LKIDYKKEGLKVGLELHQQLDTSEKLFCSCRPDLFKEKPEMTFLRRLRPTQSELGQIDPAAYFEFQKEVKILYEANGATSCLVEMDEEPPHPLNREAVDTTLTAALLMNAKTVDEIHVMRKTVIDGSNTTGFQRTCIIARNGEVNMNGKTIPIQHVSLEEDAARKTRKAEGSTLFYRIDRLGIPLVEVATAPVIKSPAEAKEVASTIGRILRATGKVKRGLGTIRQDLNVSISDGGLIEIKGVQKLELLPLVIKYEVQRQLKLLEISTELRKRDLTEKNLKTEILDVTDVFPETKCKILHKALNKGKRILAVNLSKFKGLLKQELMPNFRLGTEMADRARFWGRVGGIFHTDELPAYGITAQEIKRLRESVKAEDQDAVVFVADDLENAKDALKAVVKRTQEAIKGVPDETRAAEPDGTTHYMRPRPGAARMYPETDIPPIRITEETVKTISQQLPELPQQKLESLVKKHELNQKLARQILDSKYYGLFKTIVRECEISPTIVAAFLTETLKALGRDGVQVDNISTDQFREIFKKVGSGELTKEALPDVIDWLSKNENKDVQDAIENLGLKIASENEIRKLVETVVHNNRNLIRERGEKSFGVLMGAIMKKMRGRVDAAQATRLLKEKLKNLLE